MSQKFKNPTILIFAIFGKKVHTSRLQFNNYLLNYDSANENRIELTIISICQKPQFYRSNNITEPEEKELKQKKKQAVLIVTSVEAEANYYNLSWKDLNLQGYMNKNAT